MTRHISKRCSALLVTCSLLLGWNSPALAQAAAGADTEPQGGLQDIIVTAQRRSESVQRSSLSIQVLGQEALQQAGVTSASDLNSLLPGVQIAQAGAPTQIFIRGVGDVSANPLGNAAVAFHVDGIYLARPSATSTAFYDVARIEVLKGPQGTLYGRNASGGAINLITNAPKLGDLSGYVEGEIGNYGLLRSTGAINLPVGDSLAVRAAYSVVDRDGYLSDGTNDQKTQAGRLRALWEPTDTVSLLLNFDAAHQGGNGTGFVVRPLVDRDTPWLALSSDEGNAAIQAGSGGLAIDSRSRPVFQDNDFINASAQLDWDAGFATLTLLPAFRHTREDYQIANGLFYSQKSSSDQYSVEMRLSNSAGPLKWVVGGYYFKEDQSVAARAVGNLFFLDFTLDYRPKTTAYAAFGEATYSLTDKLRIIGGLRYTREDKSLAGVTVDRDLNVGPGGPVPQSPDEIYGVPGARDPRFTATTWKAGLEYDLAPDSMLFFTASTGFKAGGQNPVSGPNIFRPEKLTAYVFGARNRFLDNRLQVNAELFWWDYRNKQESSIGASPLGNLVFLTRNSGTATIKGGTLDVTARPSDNDTFHLFIEYNKARYDSFVYQVPTPLVNPFGIGCGASANGGVTTIDCSGNQLIRAPEWTASLSYSHGFRLGSGAVVTAAADGQLSDSYWISTDFVASERAASYITANASLTFTPPSARWSLTGYIRNIGKTPVYTGGNQITLAAPLFAANILAPRTFGARFRFNF